MKLYRSSLLILRKCQLALFSDRFSYSDIEYIITTYSGSQTCTNSFLYKMFIFPEHIIHPCQKKKNALCHIYVSWTHNVESVDFWCDLHVQYLCRLAAAAEIRSGVLETQLSILGQIPRWSIVSAPILGKWFMFYINLD